MRRLGTLGLSVMVTKGGNDLTVGVTGPAGFIVLFIVNAGILFMTVTWPENHSCGDKLSNCI